MASAETVLLQSTLEIENKAYSVKLTSSEIYWEVITSARAAGGPYSEPLVSVARCLCSLGKSSTQYQLICETESQTVKINEILAVKLGGREAEYDRKFRSLEMVTLSPTHFVIWVLRRCQRHKWRDRRVTFHSKDTSVLQQWVSKVQELLTRPELNRPKSLLVLINPVGGRRRGPKVYQDKVAPLFDLAGISTDVVTTQRQNHARDLLMDYDLNKIDGVVCVGGDGMFTEVMHGLINRTVRDKTGSAQPTPSTKIPQTPVRIGIIPAGSTDTVCYTTLGINDPVTAAIHIMIGDKMAMDVATVFHGNQFTKYNVSLLGYGFYGDCILGSEDNRWMGPKRYDWEGVKKVLGLRVYEGEITYIPSGDRENNPRDGTFCKAGCSVCQSIDVEPSDGGATLTQDGDTNALKIRGRFVAINSFLISCRCRFSPSGPAPSAHLGDGCTDLVVVKECSRFNYVRYLFRCSKKNLDQFDFDFMHVVRVKEFQFRPLVDEIDDTVDGGDNKMASQQRLRSRGNHNSVWNCDGEVVEEPSIDFKVHRQVIRLFARGIEDEVKEHGSRCPACLK